MKDTLLQNKVYTFCKKIADNESFQSGILILILINAAFLGFETSNEMMSLYGDIIVRVLVWSQLIFVGEIIIRLVAFGPKNYKEFFKDFWNRFDFIIVLLSFLPEIGGIITVVRVLRVLRVLRILSISDRLRDYLSSLKTTSSGIIVGGIIYIVITYTIAIIGYYLFSNIDATNWGTLGQSYESVVFMTLFQDVRGIFHVILTEHKEALIFIIGFYLLELLLLIKLVYRNTYSR